MRLTAIFEEWYIGDGNYPPLRKQQLVNVAFEMHPQEMSAVAGDSTILHNVGNAEYEFAGLVLRHYRDAEEPILLVEADGFRFYIADSAASFENLHQGQWVSGKGTLTLDHYLWAEFCHEYDSGPPDLFYTLRVARISEVEIPASHIVRDETGHSAPTWLPAGEVQNSREVESMAELKWEVGFYLVEYDDEGVGKQVIPRTFT
jgi:hypothetical protein